MLFFHALYFFSDIDSAILFRQIRCDHNAPVRKSLTRHGLPMKNKKQSILQFWQLLQFRVQCRLKSEASTSYLSYGWWVLEPVLHMGMFYLIFKVLLNRGTEDFVAYLLCGLIPWLWFNKSISNASGSISSARGIMMQTRIPVILFPAEVVAQDSLRQLIVFSVLFVFLLLCGEPFTIYWTAVIPVVIVQLLFTFALSLLVAAIIPFLPDVRFLIQTGLLMLMMGSGIFYSYEVILPEHRSLFFMNPMANLIHNYRRVLMYQQWPDWQALALIGLASLVLIVVLTRLLRGGNATYARLILES
ncbi:ABC transporter permease [Thiolapillus sp.]|uniref:ABC transporter permease n=7 Tax=Thiolapillus sp. TaxID=2017437 RepID=UPI003AF984D3